MVTFWIFEVEDSVVITEEVDFVDSQGVSSYLLDDVFDNLIVASLHKHTSTTALLTTLTLRRWLPLPPVLASPTFSRSL